MQTQTTTDDETNTGPLAQWVIDALRKGELALLATEAQIERIFGTPRKTLQSQRWRREGCRYTRDGRRVKYSVIDYARYLDAQAVDPSAE